MRKNATSWRHFLCAFCCVLQPQSYSERFLAVTRIHNWTGTNLFQIGNLEYWGGNPDDLRTYEDAANGTWFPTRFHAVMRFGRNGAANGVFAIYDFYPEDEDLQARRKLDDRDWGYLPSGVSDQPISMAKIANKITDLRFGRTFDFVGPPDYPVELVRAMKTPGDTIIRVTVA